MKRILLSLLVLLPLAGFGKPAYKITLQVDGCTDSNMLMCYYFAQNMHIADSARLDRKGRFVFEGDQELKPGLYFFTNRRDHYAEFVVYHEKPFFQFRTDNRNWATNMTVKGSRQNEIFYNFQRASDVLYRELEEAKPTMDSAAYAQFTRQQLLKVDTLRMKFISQYPDAMICKMMMASKDVDLPEKGPDGNDMSRHEKFDWILQHYFDHMPLDDNFIIRTPKAIFYQRVMDYIDKYTRGLQPSDLIPLIDTLIDRSEPAADVYQWLVNTLTEHYLQSTVMVYDEVYVHLVKRYFATGKASWLQPSTIDMNVERANKWERLLVGHEAPELVLFDTLHYAHSLHRMRGRYTLLLFWSPTCGHCREVIPAIYKAFDEVADSLDITAFAIFTEPEEETTKKWKKFLADHHMTNPRWVNLNGIEANVDWREVYDISSTPQIFLIDNKDHTFIAKKLNANLFQEICKSLKTHE